MGHISPKSSFDVQNIIKLINYCILFLTVRLLHIFTAVTVPLDQSTTDCFKNSANIELHCEKFATIKSEIRAKTDSLL